MGKTENTITIVAVDLNAVADESYRESKRMHPRDSIHQAYMEDNHMVSVHAYNSTGWTYVGHNHMPKQSKIYYFLTNHTAIITQAHTWELPTNSDQSHAQPHQQHGNITSYIMNMCLLISFVFQSVKTMSPHRKTTPIPKLGQESTPQMDT